MAPFVPTRATRWLLPLALLAAVGCSKSKDAPAPTPASTTAKITGKVTYSRIPLLKDSQGVPTGLETDSTKFSVLPAKSVAVRLWVAEDETDSLGNTSRPWRVVETTSTDTDGTYTFTSTPKVGADAFVELMGVHFPSSSPSIRLVADPAGVDSPTPQSERPIYLIRKGVGGLEQTGNTPPGEKVTADATVNFEIGQATHWWLNTDQASRIDQAVKESTPSGSRILGILDSIADFATNAASPSLSTVLDLHYKVGVSHPRGSFVEYDRARYPQAYAAGGYHYFGSLRGGAGNDDAWDPAVIATLAAQNAIFNRNSTPWPFIRLSDPWNPQTRDSLVKLHPTAAYVHGCVLALAAISQKSPYLADTQSSGPIRLLDVRDVGTAPRDMFSAPNVQALTWELALKANSLPTPGTTADWDKLTAAAITRLFTPVIPVNTDNKPQDVVTIYGQLSRLQADREATETVDLKTIFTDDALKTLLPPFGLEWPRPATGPLATFLKAWDTDFPVPTGKSQFSETITLGMADATVDGEGKFSGASMGETYSAIYATSKDQAYFLDIQPLPPVGTKLEVRISTPQGLELRTYEATTSADPQDPIKRFVFRNTNSASRSITFHLVSPDTRQADYTFTLTLHKAP